GQGRERPWQATPMPTDVPDLPDDPDFAAASGQFRVVLAERYFHWLMRWLAERPSESAAWQQADLFGDLLLYLTADELKELGTKVRELVDGYADRTARPELRPEEARMVAFLPLAFPMIGPPIGPSGEGQGGGGDSR